MKSSRKCFVVMSIGDQEFDGNKITETELRSKYDDLIKEAILKADPNLDITRADDVPLSGTITSDIITRIMHSELVVADVTFPNPNVFYELGLRHACKPGTLIIKDKNGPNVPFDIAHLRYLEYENTPTGLKKLTGDIERFLEHMDGNPLRPDNLFLELAQLTHYEFQDYSEAESYDEDNAQVEALMALMSSPALMGALMNAKGGEVNEKEMFEAIGKDPEVAKQLIGFLIRSGQLNMFSSSNTRKRTNQRKKRR